MTRLAIIGVAAALAGGAAANGTDPARADPRDPRAVVPPLRYESALSSYKPAQDTPLARWRDANRNVGALGGHTGHTRSATPAPLPAADAGAKP